MYEIIATTGVTVENNRMSLTLGANKWASRVVIILQLAAWSSVGIVLLQKGVTSLQKMPEAANGTRIQILALNDPKDRSNEANELAVVPLSRNYATWKSTGTEDQDVSGADYSRGARTTERLSPSSPLSNGQRSHGTQEYSSKAEGKGFLENLAAKLTAQSLFEERNKGMEQLNKETFDISARRYNELHTDNKVNESLDRFLANVNETVKTMGSVETRKRLRLSRLSGGGAAAAVAMVAVGAVMLVLGPAVIILRALDERRQERRFLKLSGQDDLPPTYEQATLMDEAPRYSSLSLDTIQASPPPSIVSVHD
ncbi:uncharacterized protein [Prorops nasuta]|uniref:uncharacterized protein n=1 Tax=Prorops nasuta TaxID=863751 RepID=UPI0034CEB0E7